MDSDDEENVDTVVDIFQEPKEYFKPPRPPTYESFTLDDGRKLSLQLVGENPLWAHHLWNGARVLAKYLQKHRTALVSGRRVLELGAAAGLPSLVSAILGARAVVATDYPDQDIIRNLQYNILNCEHIQSIAHEQGRSNIVAAGYLWGAPVDSLISQFAENNTTLSETFATVLLADLLYNHSEHQKLVRTVRCTLARTDTARALVFFTPYRPWLLEKDLAFFDLIRHSHLDATVENTNNSPSHVLGVNQILQDVMEKVMFENDRGDELLRRTVFGYEIFWADLQP